MSKTKEHYHDKIEAGMRKVGLRDRVINMIDWFFGEVDELTEHKEKMYTREEVAQLIRNFHIIHRGDDVTVREREDWLKENLN